MTEQDERAMRIVFKGVVGAFPVIGPMAAEVVETLIPNQRLERIEKLLMKLDKRVADIDYIRLKARFSTPDFVDLLEDGFHQAARALSDERLDHIASLLERGLREEDLKHSYRKRLMNLLGELADPEIIILKGHDWKTLHDKEYWKKHESVLMAPVYYIGGDQESHDRAAIHRSHQQHLVQLGLMGSRYKNPKKGEIPEMDEKTGMLKVSGQEITPLGRLLLDEIGIGDKR